MTSQRISGLFLLLAGAWLARAARLPDERWGRLTVSWPTPWPTLSPARRAAIRRGAAVTGAFLAGTGVCCLWP